MPAHTRSVATDAPHSIHLSALVDAWQVWLENLSKTNPGGTQLNDEAVDKRTLLDDGDVIAICGRRFRFDYGAR